MKDLLDKKINNIKNYNLRFGKEGHETFNNLLTEFANKIKEEI